ncbi:MAG: hypothetical protein H0U62_02370 [Actinobacteria bacterium]|nr:hypothetical protein [Actinomycetota bacterium]
MLVTETGLWTGSDTNTIGSPKRTTYTRKKLAFFPWEGGTATPPERRGTLPGDVYLMGPQATGSTATVRRRHFTGTQVEGPTDAPFDFAGARTRVRGAFMVDKTLFYGRSDETFWRRPMYRDGLGPAERIDPYLDPAWTGVKDGSNGVYNGARPGFYAQLPRVTGMFYSPGRLYYTRSNSAALHWRPFSVDSGIVGPVERRVRSAIDFTRASGIFRAQGSLYFADRTSDQAAPRALLRRSAAGQRRGADRCRAGVVRSGTRALRGA